jgi:hypothetical protein
MVKRFQRILEPIDPAQRGRFRWGFNKKHIMKKNTLIIFLLCCNAFTLLAQKDSLFAEYRKLKSIAKLAVREKDVKIFDSYVKNELTNKQTEHELAEIALLRMNTLASIHKKTILRNKGSDEAKKIQKEIFEEGEKGVAFQKSPHIEIARIARLKKWKKYGLVDTIAWKKEEEALKANGYRPEKENFGISVFYTYNESSNFFGASFVPITFFQKSFKMKNFEGKVVYRSPLSYTMEGFPITFAYDFQSKTSEFTAALVQVNGPIFLNLTKFGWQSTKNTFTGDTKNYFFYRPEIAIGYANFSAALGRNFYFKNDDYTEQNKTTFTVKYNIVF